MALKDILVHLDDGKACDGRVEAAIRLARSHDARLTGLYMIGAPSLPTFVDAQLPEEFIREEQQRLKDSTEKAKARFVEAVDKAGLIADCRIDGESREPVALAFARHARYVDLAVVGQPDPDEDELPGSPLVENAFLSSGRPALVVPYIGAPEAMGTRVIVAWDASREAARAVNDALPILAKAKSVMVLAVNPRGATREDGRRPGADIALHLARHDITVESKVTRGHRYRRHHPVARRRRERRPAGHGRLRPLAAARDGPGRGHAPHAAAHDHTGVDVPLIRPAHGR